MGKLLLVHSLYFIDKKNMFIHPMGMLARILMCGNILQLYVERVIMFSNIEAHPTRNTFHTTHHQACTRHTTNTPCRFHHGIQTPEIAAVTGYGRECTKRHLVTGDRSIRCHLVTGGEHNMVTDQEFKSV